VTFALPARAATAHLTAPERTLSLPGTRIKNHRPREGADNNVNDAESLRLLPAAAGTGYFGPDPRCGPTTTTPTAVEVLRDAQAFARLGSEWKRLCSESTSPHFFHDFAWKWHTWQCVASRKRDQLRILVARQKDRVVLILPLVIGDRVARFLNSASWEYRDMIVDDAANLDDALRACWRELRAVREVDLLLLQNVRTPSALSRLLDAVEPRFWCVHDESPVIRLADYRNWDHYAASRPTKLMADQRRQWRRLRAAVPDLECNAVRNKAEIERLVHWMLDRKTEWALHKKRSLQGFFRAEQAALLIRAAEEAFDSGGLLLYRLAGGGQTISAGMGFVANRQFTFELFSYDLQWENFSPSRLLQEQMIRWCFDNGIAEFDFLPFNGEGSPYKKLWTDATVESVSYAIPMTLRGLALIRWQKSAVARALTSLRGSSASALLPRWARSRLRRALFEHMRPLSKMSEGNARAAALR
jgi:CelD/BcsL family acetyltransferase involved in cellulose biosynthesis